MNQNFHVHVIALNSGFFSSSLEILTASASLSWLWSHSSWRYQAAWTCDRMCHSSSSHVATCDSCPLSLCLSHLWFAGLCLLQLEFSLPPSSQTYYVMLGSIQHAWLIIIGEKGRKLWQSKVALITLHVQLLNYRDYPDMATD